MIDINDAERVGVMVAEWQPQRLSAAAAAAKLIANEFTDEQLGSLVVSHLVDRLLLSFAIPPVSFLRERSKFVRNRDGRPGGAFVMPLENSIGAAAALRYRGAHHAPVPQLYVLDEWHPFGPAVIFEFDDPSLVQDYDVKIRNNVESLNVTLLIRTQTIENEIRSVVEHFVDDARERKTKDILERAEADRFYAALPFEEMGGSPRIEHTLVILRKEQAPQPASLSVSRRRRSVRRNSSPGRDNAA